MSNNTNALRVGIWNEILHTRSTALGGVLQKVSMVAEGGGVDGLVERQVARMWLSPKGAVSPLHYDSNMSILTQVRLWLCLGTHHL